MSIEDYAGKRIRKRTEKHIEKNIENHVENNIEHSENDVRTMSCVDYLGAGALPERCEGKSR